MTDDLVLAGADGLGSIRVPAATLARLVTRAAERVDGVRVRKPRRGLDVRVADGRASVAVEVAVRYGEVVPEVGAAVQERVGEALAVACGLAVESVDVHVAEVAR